MEQTRLTQQCADAQRREKILMRRLANKEQEFQDYVVSLMKIFVTILLVNKFSLYFCLFRAK